MSAEYSQRVTDSRRATLSANETIETVKFLEKINGWMCTIFTKLDDTYTYERDNRSILIKNGETDYLSVGCMFFRSMMNVNLSLRGQRVCEIAFQNENVHHARSIIYTYLENLFVSACTEKDPQDANFGWDTCLCTYARDELRNILLGIHDLVKSKCTLEGDTTTIKSLTKTLKTIYEFAPRGDKNYSRIKILYGGGVDTQLKMIFDIIFYSKNKVEVEIVLNGIYQIMRCVKIAMLKN